MNRRPRKMTAEQKKDADWVFNGQVRNCGSDRVWVEQKDTKTGLRRWVYGKTIRYTKPRS